MSQYLYVIDILSELICHLFLFAILTSKVKCFDRVAIEGSLFSVDHRIITIDSHCLVIV